MEQTSEIRALEEWMYAINTAIGDLRESGSPETLAMLQRTLDQMREHRAQLRLRRHNESGY